MPGRIILLNGTSSAGKTSLAKAVQDKAAETFYLVSIDDFINMAGEHAFERDAWRILREAMRNFCAVINVLYDLDRNILIDVVGVKDGTGIFSELVEALKGKSVLLTHVRCDLNELAAREEARGDRLVGLARSQYDQAYGNIPYDVIADTTSNSAEHCADIVLEAFYDSARWKGFSTMDASQYEP
ncbi:MAG: hypothetical protein ABFC62_12365 [Clostridiaceae bacterium]|nr:hypothetical protein [Eubacteriales bacterium]